MRCDRVVCFRRRDFCCEEVEDWLLSPVGGEIMRQTAQHNRTLKVPHLILVIIHLFVITFHLFLAIFISIVNFVSSLSSFIIFVVIVCYLTKFWDLNKKY